MTHDYKRNGTIDLFAALNVATGEVMTECATATPAPTCCVLQADRAAVPRRLDVHVVLDNLSAHTTPEITKWLAHQHRAAGTSISFPRRAPGST